MADPKNPSGALPGDPRYGLNEAELKEYYRTKSPTWIIRSKSGPKNAEVRMAHTPDHMEYLRAANDRLRFSGPTLSDDGATVTGGINLLDAPGTAPTRPSGARRSPKRITSSRRRSWTAMSRAGR